MADNKIKLSLQIDLRIVVGVLLAVIIGMLLAWMPWQKAEDNDNVIKVTGEAVIKAEPDQYVFYPSYQFTNADKTAAINAANAKGAGIVAKLKELGVPESKIRTDINGYKNQPYPGNTSEDFVYNLQVTVTLDSKDKAQAIQDYLTTTSPENSVTPQGSFSEAKRNELEAKARDEATKDARAKADQSAKNLGFKVGRVKSVEDGAGFGGITPLMEGRAVALDSASEKSPNASMNIMPGENELRYSVTVTYFVR